jgi:NAD(P)-dependent dehydrogenase (short-subunit alcohol dehydrogenase family)
MIQNNYKGALQHPIDSGFSAQSTTTEVIKGIDLSGKTAIVTGGNTGIGLETTKTLAEAGATVIVAARNVEKARENLTGIARVEIEAMDIMDPASIDAFAQKFIESGRPLHLLINNAGIMWVPLRRDKRGIESQLATNYVGPFHLTKCLWRALRKANAARVVNVSSLGHHNAGFNFDDPNFERRGYETLEAYGQSKTACNLFSVELDARAQQTGIRAYSVHPGSIAGTELAREAPIELFQKMGFLDDNGALRPEVLASLKTIPQGAATTIWAAVSPLLDTIGGVYCEDCNIAELLSPDLVAQQNAKLHESGVLPYSLDKESASRLWQLTEAMTGIDFTTD